MTESVKGLRSSHVPRKGVWLEQDRADCRADDAVDKCTGADAAAIGQSIAGLADDAAVTVSRQGEFQFLDASESRP